MIESNTPRTDEMKLSQLTTEDKIKLAAELDGKPEGYWWCPRCKEWIEPSKVTFAECHDHYRQGCAEGVDANKPYHTSYDAIIPLIQKQPQEIQDGVAIALSRILSRDARSLKWYWQASQSQLLDALLVATGKAEL